MCGIAGIWNRDGKPVDETVLASMSECLVHRGPDDAGIYVEAGIGLAHRRLSIIDLSSAGKQPMMMADGRCWVVFNGEIYNYQELREKYCKGIELKSESDTEVLLHVLAQKGANGLAELRGMFALAFWDSQVEKLLLARDPFGKKPLYYSVVGDTVVFGSEVKALLAHPAVSKEVDKGAIAKYLMHEYVPAPASGFANIRQVRMGHCVEVTRSSFDEREHWKPVFKPKAKLGEKQILKELDERLHTAVTRRMIADVPVGVFLSGGLDSTTIAWYMAQQSDNVNSFSISFDEDSYNEGGFATTAAEAIGSEHHNKKFGVEEFKHALGAVTEKMDVPFADASLLPTYAVSEFAREKITVALDGDGSDELFGGYGTFQAARVSEQLPKIPPTRWKWLARMAEGLPTNYGYFSTDFKIKAFLRGMGYPLARRHQVWLGSFTDVEMKRLLTPEWREQVDSVFDDVDALAKETKGLDVTDKISYLSLHHYMHNGILTKLDRATMFVSLEARTPFLDVDLAEFVMKLPTEYKRDKAILRTLMRGRIPDEIIDRKKQGFAMPLGGWLRDQLHNWADDILVEERVNRSGVLEPAEVQRIWREHSDGQADHRKKLWTLLMFVLWWEKWVDQSA